MFLENRLEVVRQSENLWKCNQKKQNKSISMMYNDLFKYFASVNRFTEYRNASTRTVLVGRRRYRCISTMTQLSSVDTDSQVQRKENQSGRRESFGNNSFLEPVSPVRGCSEGDVLSISSGCWEFKAKASI